VVLDTSDPTREFMLPPKTAWPSDLHEEIAAKRSLYSLSVLPSLAFGGRRWDGTRSIDGSETLVLGRCSSRLPQASTFFGGLYIRRDATHHRAQN
jgi:hypothetical protein